MKNNCEEKSENSGSDLKNPPKTQTNPQKRANKKKKKVKVIYTDDGHTVYDMSALGGKDKKQDQGAGLSKKERNAAIRAALAFYFPRLLLVIGCFCLTGVLIYLWLR